MPRLFDISLPIREGMVLYPGNPEVRLEPQDRIADGAVANLTLLSFGSHTGTHVDAPLHFIDGARPVDLLSLDRMIGPAVVVRIPDEVTAIDARELSRHDVSVAPRVLLRTRNSEMLGRDDFDAKFAHLTPDGARYLAESGAVLVGIDYLSVEGYGSEDHGAHLALLQREIVILEGADLRDVPAGRYELLCLPIRVAGADGAPARAVLRSLD